MNQRSLKKEKGVQKLTLPRLGTAEGKEGRRGDGTSLRAKVEMLEKDLERRTEAYIRRERAFKTRIEDLESQLSTIRSDRNRWMEEDEKMSKVKEMHERILSNVSLVQDRTSQILQEQERDLIRGFRARLYDLQTELDKQKHSQDSGVSAWIEKSNRMEVELDWAREVADRLEKTNEALLGENRRLKQQFKAQEDDRNFLIRQLVAMKKENAELRVERTQGGVRREGVLSSSSSQGEGEDEGGEKPRRGGEEEEEGGGGGDVRMSMLISEEGMDQEGRVQEELLGKVKGEIELRLREMNLRLRKLLSKEKRDLQIIRVKFEKEARDKTELQAFLRECLDDVKREIFRQNQQFALGSIRNFGPSTQNQVPESFSEVQLQEKDREQVLSMLLSKERVLDLLYDRTFPSLSQEPQNRSPRRSPRRSPTRSPRAEQQERMGSPLHPKDVAP